MREIGRRGLLQSVVLLAGVVATPAGAHALFEGPRSLPESTAALLEAVADTMIPETDTPGAVGAGVPAMFDKLLANWASEAQAAQILGALEAIEAEAASTSGTRFTASTAEQRYQVLHAFDQARSSDPGYAKLKELLVTLYYLSEIGSTVELRYEHVPGVWEPSIPVTPETRAYGGFGG